MIIGIDPGLSGALCVLHDDCTLFHLTDLPVLERKTSGGTKREIDVAALHEALRHFIFEPVYLERASSRPGEGTASSWRNGCTWGSIYALCIAAKLSVTLVTPQEWKKALRVPADKDMARKRASELLPGNGSMWPLKKHDGRAEAAMIALYGARQLGMARVSG